eukprot:COSAG06_NODE_35456_length_459_cov_20.213889_2_plen_23_part_01
MGSDRTTPGRHPAAARRRAAGGW